MNVVSSFKSKVGEFVLKKQAKHNRRTVKSCNINVSKNIGVLFNASNQASFKIVKDFVKSITTPSNNVMVLGYVDSKQMIDHYLYRKGFEFFTRNDLNWFYKPENEAVSNFISQKFDLLIDLNIEESFPMKYILSLSKSNFKVGIHTENHDLLDLMIYIESEKEAIKELKDEVMKQQGSTKDHSTSYDTIANEMSDVELQLNFLINQLVHYLSKIKN